MNRQVDAILLSNGLLDLGLSLKELGLYAQIAALPTDFRFSVRRLAERSVNSRESTTFTLNLLEDKGLISRSRQGKRSFCTLCSPNVETALGHIIVPSFVFTDCSLDLSTKGLFTLMCLLPSPDRINRYTIYRSVPDGFCAIRRSVDILLDLGLICYVDSGIGTRRYYRLSFWPPMPIPPDQHEREAPIDTAYSAYLNMMMN